MGTCILSTNATIVLQHVVKIKTIYFIICMHMVHNMGPFVVSIYAHSHMECMTSRLIHVDAQDNTSFTSRYCNSYPTQ